MVSQWESINGFLMAIMFVKHILDSSVNKWYHNERV